MQTIIKQSTKQRRSHRHILTGLLLSASLLSPSLLWAAPGDISTVAGIGQYGYSGDGGAATAAKLNKPYHATVDSEGNLYITDTSNSRIRKVDTNGVITTIAGNGTDGFSGDSDLATAASLNRPSSVAFDDEGNLYIADTNNNRIRKVGTDGMITTIAGNGEAGLSGDGNLATAAELNKPFRVAFDDEGNLYIADYNNHRIRKVDTDGIITTIAGSSTAGFRGDGDLAIAAALKYPISVALDSKGNLYIADTSNHRIRKVDTNGVITTFAGDGKRGFGGDGDLATVAQLSSPASIALDSHNNLYIADYNNHRIRKVDTDGIITTIAGNGTLGFRGDGAPATAAKLNRPISVSLDSHNNIYIADSTNNRIRKVEALEPPLPVSESSDTPLSQVISIDPVSDEIKVDDEPFTLSTNGGDSGNPLVYSSRTPSVCSVDSTGVITLEKNPGTCSIKVEQEGNDSYRAARAQTVTFKVDKHSQAILWTQAPPSNATVGDTFTISATGGDSGKAVKLRSLTRRICKLSGNTVTVRKVGICKLSASQSGNNAYSAVRDLKQTTVSEPQITVTDLQDSDSGQYYNSSSDQYTDCIHGEPNNPECPY